MLSIRCTSWQVSTMIQKEVNRIVWCILNVVSENVLLIINTFHFVWRLSCFYFFFKRNCSVNIIFTFKIFQPVHNFSKSLFCLVFSRRSGEILALISVRVQVGMEGDEEDGVLSLFSRDFLSDWSHGDGRLYQSWGFKKKKKRRHNHPLL